MSLLLHGFIVINNFYYFFIFIYLAASGLSCSTQDLLLLCTSSLVVGCDLQ